MRDEAILIGVDENGLGSRLGPMTVTAVRVRVDRRHLEDRRALQSLMMRAGIADSKTLCAHGSMATTEARVLALLARHCSLEPDTLRAWTEQSSIESQASLERDCPDGEAPTICFGDPVALPAFGAGPSERDFAIADALRREGFALDSARVSVQCAARINLARDAGRSRMDVDLDAMLTLVDALKVDGVFAHVSLGKVGARARYHDALSRRFALVRTELESRERSTYVVPSVGSLSFVMDGDATEPAISLASMIGKYARELWMHRHNRYWTSTVDDARAASGYHDPVTERLVRATALARQLKKIPDRCFER